MSKRNGETGKPGKLAFDCEFCGGHFDSYQDLVDHYDNEHGGMRP